MANTLHFVMSAEDERAFFRFLERFHLELYPVRVPQGHQGVKISADAVDKLPEDAAYLAATELGPVLVDKLKRGPDKGMWRVDEVRSPVIYFERSRTVQSDKNPEAEERHSGKLWAELDITPQTGRREAGPDRFRVMFTEIEAYFKKTYRRSDPQGFWIGPHLAREFKETKLVIRDAAPRGDVLVPFR